MKMLEIIYNRNRRMFPTNSTETESPLPYHFLSVLSSSFHHVENKILTNDADAKRTKTNKLRLKISGTEPFTSKQIKRS